MELGGKGPAVCFSGRENDGQIRRFLEGSRRTQKNMKTTIQLFLYLVIAGVLASCQTCKIEPPPTGVDKDKQAGAKAAADALSTAISKGSIEANYHNVVKTTYVTVNQDDVAFYLLLQAYNCESARRGHVAQADALMKMAREELARRHQASTGAIAENPTTLTPTEKRVLKESPLKQEIVETIKAPKSTPAAKTKMKSKAKEKPKASPTPSQ